MLENDIAVVFVEPKRGMPDSRWSSICVCMHYCTRLVQRKLFD